MEDKELQELFAAKRTVEANRRRQEELAAMIGRKTAKKRPLWPVWAGAAAAAVLLLLIAMPSLFRQPESTPLLVAQADPHTQPAIDMPMPEQRISRPLTERGIQQSGWVKKKQQPELIVTTNEDTHPYPSQEWTANVEKSHTEQEAEQSLVIAIDEPDDNAPRIHRRTSTRMVCSDCTITNVPSQSNVFQEFFASIFIQEPSTTITLKSIEL